MITVALCWVDDLSAHDPDVIEHAGRVHVAARAEVAAQAWRNRGRGVFLPTSCPIGYQTSKTVRTQLENQWHVVAGVIICAGGDLVLPAPAHTHTERRQAQTSSTQTSVRLKLSCCSRIDPARHHSCPTQGPRSQCSRFAHVYQAKQQTSKMRASLLTASS